MVGLNKVVLALGASLINVIFASSYNRCPAVTDRCIGDDLFPAPDHPRTSPCWKKVKGKWHCSNYAADGPAKCQPGETAIASCLYDIKQPECPKRSDMCNDYGTKFPAKSPSTPPCWYKDPTLGDEWQCFGGYPCSRARGLVDIYKCPGLAPKDY